METKVLDRRAKLLGMDASAKVEQKQLVPTMRPQQIAEGRQFLLNTLRREDFASKPGGAGKEAKGGPDHR